MAITPSIWGRPELTTDVWTSSLLVYPKRTSA